MFDKHYFIQGDRSEQAAHIVTKGLKNLGDDLKSISEADISARDRVDITLKEYEKLKSDVKRYEDRCRRMGQMIMQMGIPYEVIEHIIPGSIDVCTCEDIFNFKRRYRVEFDVEDGPHVPR